MANDINSQLLSILKPNQFFGPDDWKEFYGIKVENAELPATIENLSKILNAPCPFFPGKKIKKTHYLLFIPGKINQKGNQLDIRTLQKFFPKDGEPRFYRYLSDTLADNNQPYADERIKKDTWILVLNGVIPHSRYETYAEQLTMLPNGYIIPTALAITTFHLSSHQKSGNIKHLFGRTSSFDFEKRRIYTSGVNGDEIFICATEDRSRNGDLGVYAIKEL